MLSTMRMGVASLEHNNKHHARVPNGGQAVVFGTRVRPIFIPPEGRETWQRWLRSDLLTRWLRIDNLYGDFEDPPVSKIQFPCEIPIQHKDQDSPLPAGERRTPFSRSRAMSLVGEFPKYRPYSRLNCEALM